MHRRYPVLALFTAITLAACSPDNVVTPVRSAPKPNFDLSAGDASRQHLVLLRGKAIPKDFDSRLRSLGGAVKFTHGGSGFAVVTGLSDAAAAQLATGSDVAEVDLDASVGLDQPAPHMWLDGTSLGKPSIESVNNPARALGFALGWQWNMNLIKADAAWTASKLGSSSVTVAILDTGIDYDGLDLGGHVDLSRSVSFMSAWVGPADVPPGPSDDQITTTRFPGRNLISDYNGHGTNVSSQVSSNAFLFAGVTSKTTLIGVKVLGANGFGTFGGILSGVLWAADHDADAANMSLGGSFSKAGNGRLVRVIDRVFDYAHRKGMVVVVAAGNDGINLDRTGRTFDAYCDAPHVICVSAVGPVTSLINPDQPAFYSNFGRRSVDVAAPGGSADVSSGDGTKEHPFPVSPRPWGPDFASWVWNTCSKTLIAHDKFGREFMPCTSGQNLDGYIGTSQATPHVAGLAALLIADNGHRNPERIKQIIERTGDPIDPQYGEGRINVPNALGLNRPPRDR